MIGSRVVHGPMQGQEPARVPGWHKLVDVRPPVFCGQDQAVAHLEAVLFRCREGAWIQRRGCALNFFFALFLKN